MQQAGHCIKFASRREEGTSRIYITDAISPSGRAILLQSSHLGAVHAIVDREAELFAVLCRARVAEWHPAVDPANSYSTVSLTLDGAEEVIRTICSEFEVAYDPCNWHRFIE